MIPADRMMALNAGTAQSRTLTEALAVDFATLLHKVAPGIEIVFPPGEGITRRMVRAGEALAGRHDRFVNHPSDTVRGWAAYAIAAAPRMKLASRLKAIQPLAADPHFGVREWAWLALRPHLAAEIGKALTLLTPWTTSQNEFLRRFASEATRPRGVWCTHIESLKAEPSPGLVILEPLRADPARYVQDSVANWLNDASKSRPDWVRDTCSRWLRESPCSATQRIARRALRTAGAQARQVVSR